jgi:hypothetical protein
MHEVGVIDEVEVENAEMTRLGESVMQNPLCQPLGTNN